MLFPFAMEWKLIKAGVKVIFSPGVRARQGINFEANKSKVKMILLALGTLTIKIFGRFWQRE